MYQNKPTPSLESILLKKKTTSSFKLQVHSNYKTNNAAPIAAATKPLPAILAAAPELVLVVAAVVVEAGELGLVVMVPLVVVPLMGERISLGIVTSYWEQRAVARVTISAEGVNMVGRIRGTQARGSKRGLTSLVFWGATVLDTRRKLSDEVAVRTDTPEI